MSGVHNPEQSAALEFRKRELEQDLRAPAVQLEHDGVGSEPVVRAYVDYCRGHGKTYHPDRRHDLTTLALRRQFGPEYEHSLRTVPGWWPRRPRRPTG
jgi:hypothetical protein